MMRWWTTKREQKAADRTAQDEVRPRAGWIERADGTRTPVRFVRTENPKAFLAVTVDGERAIVNDGDQVSVDVVGPGQTVVIKACVCGWCGRDE